MRRAVLLATVVLAVAAAIVAIPKAQQPASGWTYPVIKDYGRAWPLPHAAVQPEKNKQYKVIFDLLHGDDPKGMLMGLGHAARMVNVFAALGVPRQNLHIVAVFHGAAGFAAMNNDVYRAKYNVDNPNAKVIAELNQAGVEFYLCGQTLHEHEWNDRDMLPGVKLATAAVVVLPVYENNGYALMAF